MLMRQRAPIYESLADITVSTDGRRVRTVAEDILCALGESFPSADPLPPEG